MMWPFKRKQSRGTPEGSGIPCPHCKSPHTVLKAGGESYSDYVKTWRGQRYIVFRCNECGKDFYKEANQELKLDKISSEDALIEDEAALHEAEEQIKRQADIDGDHRFG